MSQLLLEGRTFLPDGSIQWRRIGISGPRVESVEPLPPPDRRDVPEDHLIVPAFIDLHVHGGGGHDFADADTAAIGRILQAHALGGTGALAATIVSSPPEATLRAIDRIAAFRGEEGDGAEIGGIHLEGPYLNKGRCGAQNPASLRLPDPAEVDAWLEAANGLPLTVTLAPELDGGLELIERYPEIRFSLGHSSATHAQCVRAFAAGARSVTHLFNAMSPLHHREPALPGAGLLTEAIDLEVIADGHHVHPAVLQLASRVAGNRIVLVTDAIAATGSADATARLGGLDVRIEDGAARLADGTLAGSVITMREAMVTMVELAGVPIEKVLPMMTSRPAAALAIDHRKGSIAPGMDADLLVLDRRLQIVRRIVKGMPA